MHFLEVKVKDDIRPLVFMVILCRLLRTREDVYFDVI